MSDERLETREESQQGTDAMHTGQWCHSQSDRFHGFFDTRDQAIDDGRLFYDGEAFKVGVITHPMDMVSVDVDTLLDNLEVNLFDQIGYEDQIIELSKDKRTELQVLIEEFLRREATFNSGGVTQIEDVPAGEGA